MSYPGRDERYLEENCLSILGLANDALKTIGTNDESFAFFGHSLGALVAFEVARILRRHSQREPSMMIASASPAPHLPRTRPLISHLPQAEFIDALKSKFDVSAELMSDPLLADYIYPILVADFKAVESYHYEPEAPLACAIMAFMGKDDIEADKAQVLAWQLHTSHPLCSYSFRGGHFFIHLDQGSVLAQIADTLSELSNDQ